MQIRSADDSQLTDELLDGKAGSEQEQQNQDK